VAEDSVFNNLHIHPCRAEPLNSSALSMARWRGRITTHDIGERNGAANIGRWAASI